MNIKFRYLPLLFLVAVQAQQTQADSYTRYELLAPESHSFRIVYDVSATKADTEYYWNTLRKGSQHTVNKVTDLFSGQPLEWQIVSGNSAKENGLEQADKDTDYLQIKLARAVPEGGQGRLRIDKTYLDNASYYQRGDTLVFSRTLGIKRNSIVLPPGYELIECNYPSQVQMTSDGQLKVSFMNNALQPIPLRIAAKRLPQDVKVKPLLADYTYDGSGSGRNRSKARIGWQFEERAFQNRDIVYFLQQPETHSFRLYHDYTETRVGMDRYLNVVRAGSKASNPSAILLDTGASLKVEELKGNEISERGIQLNDEILPDTEVIAIWYDAVQAGESKRLRITETYTDTKRYLLYDDHLIWDRSFGRNRNTVILPPGWFLTTSSIPALIDQNEDGLLRLRYTNPRPDAIDVYITAQRKYRK